jgi:hypothetical protein
LLYLGPCLGPCSILGTASLGGAYVYSCCGCCGCCGCRGLYCCWAEEGSGGVGVLGRVVVAAGAAIRVAGGAAIGTTSGAAVGIAGGIGGAAGGRVGAPGKVETVAEGRVAVGTACWGVAVGVADLGGIATIAIG